MKLGRLILFFIIGVIVVSSCRREDQIYDSNDARLNFSTDSITFDTVFTTVGSVTKNFRVYNPYKETIEISSIRIRGGEGSNFRMNVDGIPGSYHENVEIAPEDSMYIFVEATVDPNDQTNPFVIEDFIEFNTNGNRQNISLVAWGQNAIYFTPTTFSNALPDYTCLTGPCSDIDQPVNVTWTDSLPYVVYGFVVVDSMDQLTIEEGANIYFHQNGGLWVYKDGTLKVNGTKEKPVTFQGDRLEMAYEDRPGQWDRIWINQGGNHEINYAIIKNGFIGLQVEPLPFEPAPYDANDLPFLRLNNTIIDNCSGFGLLASLAIIDAENLLISDCGQYNVALRGAGLFDFTHSTFANYFDQADRETPTFFVQNSWVNALGQQSIDEPQVNVFNSIIYGDLESEFQTEVISSGNIDFDIRNTIIKTDQSTGDTSKFKNIIRNPTNDIFVEPEEGDYKLQETSIARNAGDLNIGQTVPLDLEEVDRTTDGQPDLGVYEFVPE